MTEPRLQYPSNIPQGVHPLWKRILAVVSAVLLMLVTWGAVAESRARVEAQNLGIGVAALAVLANTVVHRLLKRRVTWKSRSAAAFLGGLLMHLGVLKDPNAGSGLNFADLVYSDATLFGMSVGFGAVAAVIINLFAFPFTAPGTHRPNSQTSFVKRIGANVAQWHGAKLLILWAGAAAFLMFLQLGASRSERQYLFGFCILLVLPLVTITWLWLSGRERK
jgi:hypothetical protein